MKTKQGFTLIELLIVVLIIGILAAIALPQYQKAVIKSQGVQAMTLLKTVGNAVESYIMTNGYMPASFDELDISLPGDFTGTESCSHYTTDVHSNGKWAISLEKSDSLDDFNAIWMCQLTGKYKGSGFGIQVTKPTGNSHKTREIICAEYSTFELNQGDYCTKIFNTNNIVGTGAVTSFQMSY